LPQTDERVLYGLSPGRAGGMMPHVARDKRVERVMQHRLRKVAHPGQIDQRFHWRVSGVSGGGVGEVDREVANALEIAVDSQSCEDDAEVDGHRLSSEMPI
jgi:hypothetical protein